MVTTSTVSPEGLQQGADGVVGLRGADRAVSAHLRRENFPVTIHAGEAFGLPSIWEAVQVCGTDRLGHGVRIMDDVHEPTSGGRSWGALRRGCRDKRIPLEMCPSSNVQTGAAASIAEHPVTLLKDLRFHVTLNTDNRLMSATSMTREMTLMHEEAGWTAGITYTVKASVMPAISASSAPQNDRPEATAKPATRTVPGSESRRCAATG